MDRRQFLAASLLALAAAKVAAQGSPQASPMRTQWRVRSSEALDAIAFLGPLSGRSIYRDHYLSDVEAFAPKLPEAIRSDVPRLWEEADKSDFGLFWPAVALIASGTSADTLDQLIEILAEPETRARPKFQTSRYWDEKDW